MIVRNLSEKAEDFTGNVWHISNGEDVLVDTGTGDSWKAIRQLEKIDMVVITHSHYDHVDNLPKVVDQFGPDVYAFEPENLPVDAEKVEEGETLEIAGSDFRVIHTPGHKDDSICLYSSQEKILFTGDLIFPDGGFGRTDLEEGDRDRLIDSIEKIAGLDVEEFYPGHDPVVGEDANSQVQESLEKARNREPKY